MFSIKSVFLSALIPLSAFGLCTSAYAGPGTSGGGGGVACIDDVLAPGTNIRDFFKSDYLPTGEPRFVYVLDYFESKLPKNDGKVASSIFDRAGMTESGAIDAFIQKMALYGNPADNLAFILGNTIGPISAWTDTPLEILSDSGKAYRLPKGCQYVQLAVRQTETMYGDSEWIKKMSPVQRGILRIHEALYYAYYESTKKVTGGPISELQSVAVRQLFSALSNAVKPGSDVYYRNSAAARKQLSNSFSSLSPTLASLYLHPFSDETIDSFVTESSYERREICFVEMEEILRKMMSVSFPFDPNRIAHSILEGERAMKLQNPACAVQAYILKSTWKRAFHTIIGFINSNLEFDAALNSDSDFTAEKPKNSENMSAWFMTLTQWFTQSKPYFEKMADYDDSLYSATLLRMKKQ